jgi:YHS domain-containing protein
LGGLWDDSQYYKGRKGKVMATVTDPVCGMEIDSEAAAASEEYQGKTYYFCSEGCHQRLWLRRSSTPSERAVLSSLFALPAQAGVGEEAALVFCQ